MSVSRFHPPIGACLLLAATSASADPFAPPCPPGTPLVRLTPAAYDDGISSPRLRSTGPGGELPSARAISNALCAQAETLPSRKALSSMVFQWGQFVDHDITLVHTGSEPFPIAVPPGDPHFDPTGAGTGTIPMNRSTGTGSPREQINQITSTIDGSAVYGSDPGRLAALRLFSDGKLRTSAGPDGDLLPYNDVDPPLDNANENPTLEANLLFLAGDVRANEQNALTSMHTLFVREHNRLAEEILGTDPLLSDEQVYAEARRWVTAIMQSITYNEFLPAVLGEAALPGYHGYDGEVLPCVTNEFSVAAFRIGHSMLPPTLPRVDAEYQVIPEGHLSLAAAFFVPSEVSSVGIGPYLRGLCLIPQQNADRFVVDEVRNFMFGPPGSGGLDLAALNIQRGRDHGIGSYNQVRSGLGLDPALGFSDISPDSDLQATLSDTYAGIINDVDLWIGGMSEDPLPDSILGETFHYLWVDQFRRLRDGDPCWFENSDPETHPAPFSSAEIEEIRDTTLAEVIARNTDTAASGSSMFEVPAPRITRFHCDPSTGELTIEWTSFLNASYELEACNVLDGSTPFEPVMLRDGDDEITSNTMTDPAAIGVPSRFYRLRQR